MRLRHPFYDKIVPVILGEHVTTEAGTGAVHTAPGHGEEDFLVGREYDLPVTNPVGADGRYLENVELFAGEWVWAANDHVLDVMRENGSLLHSRAVCSQLSALLEAQVADGFPGYTAVVYQHGEGRFARAGAASHQIRELDSRLG